MQSHVKENTMKRKNLVALIIGVAVLSLAAGYALAYLDVSVQQKLDYVTDLRATAAAVIINIDHLADLRARQISHGGSGWITATATTGDLMSSAHQGITGTQINSAAADGPTLKAYLDAGGGAIRSDLEAMR